MICQKYYLCIKTAMMAYRYLFNFVMNGKVVSQEFCHTETDVKVLSAIASEKGCQCDVYSLDDKVTPEPDVNNPSTHATIKRRRCKKGWERSVRCIETGVVYESVMECARATGIIYRALINACQRGHPRNGLHFTFDGCPPSQPKPVKKKKTDAIIVRKVKKYVCVDTGNVYNCAADIIQKYGFPPTSFYRAVREKRKIRGMLFERA